MESSIVEVACSMGVGALAFVVVFIMYRKDKKASEERQREDRKFMEDRLTKLLEQDQESREANTKALTELVTLISRLNGKMKG